MSKNLLLLNEALPSMIFSSVYMTPTYLTFSSTSSVIENADCMWTGAQSS